MVMIRSRMVFRLLRPIPSARILGMIRRVEAGPFMGVIDAVRVRRPASLLVPDRPYDSDGFRRD
jgi:hypothetical protein